MSLLMCSRSARGAPRRAEARRRPPALEPACGLSPHILFFFPISFSPHVASDSGCSVTALSASAPPFPSLMVNVTYGGYGQRSQIVTVPPEPREPCYRSHGTRAPLTPRHVPPRAPLQPRRTPYSSYSQHGEPSHSKGGGEWCGVSQGETRGFRFALSRLYSTPRLVLRSTAAKPPERSKTRRERIAASAAVPDLCTCGPPGWSTSDQAPLTRRSRARCPSTRPLLHSDDDSVTVRRRRRYCPTTTTPLLSERRVLQPALRDKPI